MKTELPKKASLLIVSGLFIIAASQIYSHFLVLNDMAKGLLAGIGIGLLILALLILKLKKV